MDSRHLRQRKVAHPTLSSTHMSRQTLEQLIYSAAIEGDIESMRPLLRGRDPDFLKECLNSTSIKFKSTPLILAARNGHEKIVNLLILHGADPSATGSVSFDGEEITRVPPLWAASAAGHLEVCKVLLKYNVDVNQTSNTNSTPLRGACYDGHLDIVKLLVAHHADIEIANRHGHTALMISAYRRKAEVVEYLLSLGAQYDRRSMKGNTALHDGAESGDAEVIRLLLAAGARQQKDDYGITPMLSAAMLGHMHLLPLFFDSATNEEKRDAWKLMGATMVDKRSELQSALTCWRNAFNPAHYSFPDEMDDEKKTATALQSLHESVDLEWDEVKRVVYGQNTREVRSMEEVEGLVGDPDAIRAQSLVIRERILGESHPEAHYYLRYRGALYCDHGRWDRTYDLWLYILQLEQHYQSPLSLTTSSTLSAFVEALTSIIDEMLMFPERMPPPPVTIEAVAVVIDRAVYEVERFILQANEVELRDEHQMEERNPKQECEQLLGIILQLIHIIYRLKVSCPYVLAAATIPSTLPTQQQLNGPAYLCFNHPPCSNASIADLLSTPSASAPSTTTEIGPAKTVYPLKPRCPHLKCLLKRMMGVFNLLKISPLHLACEETEAHDIRRPPSKFVIDLLLKAGANVWQVEEECENTPLHVLLNGTEPRASLVRALLEAGAPLFARNKLDETCLELIQKNAPNALKEIRIGRFMSLKQLASNAVMRNLSGTTSFEGILPRDVEEFIKVF